MIKNKIKILLNCIQEKEKEYIIKYKNSDFNNINDDVY